MNRKSKGVTKGMEILEKSKDMAVEYFQTRRRDGWSPVKINLVANGALDKLMVEDRGVK